MDDVGSNQGLIYPPHTHKHPLQAFNPLMVMSNNGRSSIGGASPMQQLRHDSDSHVREDFAGCMKQLESKRTSSFSASPIMP
jgi:hypothetical protein